MVKTAIQISQEVEAITKLFFAIQTSNKVSKISPDSVLNSYFYSIAKTGQRVNKDVLVSAMKLFPDAAFGDQLDGIAERRGLPDRFAATQASTYVFVRGDSGTSYVKATHFLVSDDGQQYEFDQDFTMPAIGYTYQKIRSLQVGSNQDVDPFKITKLSPAPVGHGAVYNEYIVEGGSDNEGDTDFRNRIKIGVNELATDTLSKYEQILREINNRVLNVYKGGFDDSTGKYIIYVSTINGVDFTSGVGSELEELENGLLSYLSFVDQEVGVDIRNITYTTVDVSLRVDLNTSESDEARIDMQKNMQKKYDWRYWEFTDTISWLEMFLIAKQSKYVNNILEKYFIITVTVDGSPTDYNLVTDNIVIPEFTLPRFRSFRMYDLDGTIISDTQGVLNPAYFPTELDRIYQETVLVS